MDYTVRFFTPIAFAVGGALVVLGLVLLTGVVRADGHCPYGEAMPENPLSSACWATPADLGDVVIEFKVVPVLTLYDDRVCRQDHRVEFTGEWARGGLIRPVNVKPADSRLRLPWEERHALVGIREAPSYPELVEWHYTDAVRVAEEMAHPHMSVPTKWFVKDRVETAGGVAERSPYGWVVNSSRYLTFDWPAALRLCAQVHVWAIKAESHGTDLNLESARLGALLAAIERQSDLLGQGIFRDGEREYLAVRQWVDIQLVAIKRMEWVVEHTALWKTHYEERIREAGYDPAMLVR